VNWAKGRSTKFFWFYRERIRKCMDIRRINDYRREFYGRVSSVLKQIKDELRFLEETRKIMKGFPTIKTETKTFSIIGFPNVGKTTLLFKLTGSKPEINSYAFTTKSINVSYIRKGKEKIQLLDTPGTLNRFDRMNDIERQAFLAMKHVANGFVYVFDLTEPYPLEKQLKLLKRIKEFKLPVLVYLSKCDILDKKRVEGFVKELGYKKVFRESGELEKELVGNRK